MTDRELIVRCLDGMCFPVDRVTLEPKRCSCYDAYAFSDPRKDCDYMEFGDWTAQRADRREAEMRNWYANAGRP